MQNIYKYIHFKNMFLKYKKSKHGAVTHKIPSVVAKHTIYWI